MEKRKGLKNNYIQNSIYRTAIKSDEFKIYIYYMYTIYTDRQYKSTEPDHEREF
ncbi:hypothetical protein D3C87_1744930 [compost metagenome]